MIEINVCPISVKVVLISLSSCNMVYKWPPYNLIHVPIFKQIIFILYAKAIVWLLDTYFVTLGRQS